MNGDNTPKGYIHYCSEAKTLGAILESLKYIKGHLEDNSKKTEKLTGEVGEIKVHIFNGLTTAVEDIKDRVTYLESCAKGERPKDPETGKPVDRRKSFFKKINELPTATKLTLFVALIPIIFTYGAWFLNGINVCIDWAIAHWPK